MISTEEIKNPKLRDLVKKSLKFSMMGEEKQKSAIEQMNKIEKEEDVEKMCEFFSNENEKDETIKKEILEKQIKQMQELSAKIKEAEKTIKKMMMKEDEQKSEKEEEVQAEELLDELNNS